MGKKDSKAVEPPIDYSQIERGAILAGRDPYGEILPDGRTLADALAGRNSQAKNDLLPKEEAHVV